MSRAALACAICLGAMAVAAGAGAQVPRWQCSSTGESALDPSLAEATTEYLGRVEAIYPHQVLGLVRAGDRFYLLNSIDIEWRERTRLNLLALRLRESYLTAERQAARAAPGLSPPRGGFVCLAANRAEREGVTRTLLGEIVLAAGQSVHLVDPQEPEVAVEVRAAQNRSLNLGEIFRRSSRTGIYAGLTGQMSGQARQARGAATGQPPDGTLIIRMASAGGSAAESRVEVPEWAAAAGTERQAASSTAAPDLVTAGTELRTEQGSAPREPAPPRGTAPGEQPLTAAADSSLLSRPVLPESVASTKAQREAIAARPSPVPEPKTVPATATASVTPVDASAPVQNPVPARPVSAVIAVRGGRASTGGPMAGNVRPPGQRAAEQTYEDYAKTMRTLLLLRRSGAVRSISELTYVHPAVEVIRSRLR